MIVNHRIELDDEQRNRLARLINPRAPKRLATRKDVTEFLQGCIDTALDVAAQPRTSPPTEASLRTVARPESEQALIDRLRAEGRCDSYIHGVLQVHRSLAR